MFSERFHEFGEREGTECSTFRRDPVSNKRVRETTKEADNLLLFGDTTLGVQEETLGALLEFLDYTGCDGAIGHLRRSGYVGMYDSCIRQHSGVRTRGGCRVVVRRRVIRRRKGVNRRYSRERFWGRVRLVGSGGGYRSCGCGCGNGRGYQGRCRCRDRCKHSDGYRGRCRSQVNRDYQVRIKGLSNAGAWHVFGYRGKNNWIRGGYR